MRALMKGVLGDEGDAQVGVLLDLARVGQRLASQEFDQRRLSRPVRSDNLCIPTLRPLSCEKSDGEERMEEAHTPTREERETAQETL